MDWGPGETEWLGLAAKRALFPVAGQFGSAGTFGVAGATVFDHRPEEARQLVGGGGDRRDAQGLGETVLNFAGGGGVGPSAADPVVGAQSRRGWRNGESERSEVKWRIGA